MAETVKSMPETSLKPPENALVLRILAGGSWRDPATTALHPVFEPASGAVIAQVPYCGPAEVDAAVAAADRAFLQWRSTPVTERVQFLFRYKGILEEHFEELARMVSRENGKIIEEARGEVRRGIEVVDFACGMPSLMMGEGLEQISSGIDSHTARVPLGVVAGICPFNFPAMIPMWMFPIAIAAGNTFVLKPSERTPMTGVRLGELLLQSGLPAGVFNIVHGARETADALIAHPSVKAISFVGSEPVARYLYQRAGEHGKRVQAMAGAKNHLIVMPDADLPASLKAIINSAFGGAGQRCLAGSVAVAVGDIGDQLVGELTKAAGDLRIGDPLLEDSAMGPVIRTDTCKRVLNYIDKGLKEGATLVLDGRKSIPPGAQGFFIGPTIFDHVQPESALAQEEIFGPLLSVVRVKTLDEALKVVNRSKFGNASSIFTRSGAAARRFRTEVEAGMLGINVGVAAPMAFFPFAGWKASFFGDLHATGKDAVKFYTETRVVIERWPS